MCGERPFLGVVVEGRGEFTAYPTIMAEILNGAGAHIPIVYAGGIGDILSNLPEQLDYLVGNNHPVHVIVTLDKADALNQGDYDSCAELIDTLRDEVEDWYETRDNMTGMPPLPCNVSFVVQDPKFESWWIAGADDIVALPSFDLDPDEYEWDDVDSEVENPSSLLRDWGASELDLKSPRLAASVFSTISVLDAADRSNSLDKFRREVNGCYESWLECMGALDGGEG